MKQKKESPAVVEFQEIAHCGGEVIIETVTNKNGEREYSFGIQQKSAGRASWFGVYALSQGIAVETIIMGGIGDPWNAPPIRDCYPVFIASDSQGYFGHLCPSCQGYWRSEGASSLWFMTCPYCGIKGKPHQFLTQGQKHYVEACCRMYIRALMSPEDGKHSINFDKIADDVSKGAEKPKFYYAEESQQNKFKCVTCGKNNDILGKFGFCSCCGTRNDFQEFDGKIIPAIRERINNGSAYEACVRDIVSGFDTLAGKYIGHLLAEVPLTPARKNRLEKMSFHNLEKVVAEIKTIFDIDILKWLSADDIKFVNLMFHRRHVYEHKGGEADQKYIDDSGDKSVRPKQALSESRESAHRTANLVVKMAKNLHSGFHSIFPPESAAIGTEPEIVK